jgi:ligand-binding sensor domain-containing protein
MNLIVNNLSREPQASSHEQYTRTRRSQLVASFLMLGLVLANSPLFAQPSSLFFSNLTTRDGLPSNIISAVAQDQNDFMWIGTGNGLCRFDGYRFITFKKQDVKESLPANEISSLLIAGDHLWIGTWKGLCRLNTTTFKIERIDLGQNSVIRTLHRDKAGTIWIGTATGLVKYGEPKITVFNAQNSGLSHNTVRSIHTDNAGNLWVGTYDKLNKLETGKTTFTSFDLKGNYKPSLKNNLICDIKPDIHSDSLLWIGTETGLCHLNIFTGKTKHYSEKDIPFSNEVIKNIYTDELGQLWLGTDFGLNVFDPKTKTNTVYFHNPQQAYSIANNVIWEIVEDKAGVIWFVTSNGLARLNKFRNYYSYHEVSQNIAGQRIGNQVKSAMVSSKGILWLATLHGIVRIDSETGARETFDTKSIPTRRILLNNVYAVEEDNQGRVWIGTAGGINVWDDDKKKMLAVTSSPTNGLITNYISKFTKGTDGSFWVSAWEGGLFKVTGDYRNLASITFERAGDFGSEKNVSGSNAIWAIDYNELHRIDLTTHRDTKVSSFNAFSSKNGISCLYFSRKGSLWAGTLNGLIEYQPHSDTTILHSINTGNDITLASLNEDRHGNIWGTTNGMVVKLDMASGTTEFFPLDNDLPIKSFFDGCSAATQKGEIIFGGDNGYIVLQPDARPNRYNPKVFITALVG